MKQLRKVTALLLALALCLALAACGSAKSAPALEDFAGFWMYDDIDIAVTINDDGAWYYDWMDDEIENPEGTAKIKDGKLELLEDGEAYAVLTLRDADTLIDEDDDILRRADPSDAPEVSDAVEADFYGAWKYDAYDNVMVINDDGTWDQYDAENVYSGSSYYSFEAGVLTLQNSELEPFLELTLSGARLVDGDGDTLSRYAPPEATQPAYPTAEDALTQTGTLPDCSPAVSFMYPTSLEYVSDAEHPLRVLLQASGEGVAAEEPAYGTLMLTQIDGFDQYFTTGAAAAEKALQYLLAQSSVTMFPQLTNFAPQKFSDNGNYYSMNAFMQLPTGYFSVDGVPVSYSPICVVEVRYCGPTGYMLVTTAVADAEHIGVYAKLMQRIMDSVQLGGGWSTAVKPAPQKPSANGSDPGDYGTPYYWYDADGDVWYWDGYENIFIGFGDDYYIDDDGNYYESNDAGWDYDDYDYYYDDYDPWSDPGDGDDLWSDPGDTDYYEDDGEYYESQDSDW